ncbi:MAG: DUF1849 family protein [Pseudomonadota bacterium]
MTKSLLRRGILPASMAALLASSGLAHGQSAVENLKPHRAVYDLNLKEASDRSGITGMAGRIVYEFTGSACDGFSTRFRFLTQVRAGSKNFTNDQRTTAFESGDLNSYNFVQQSFLNGQMEKELRGNAERKGGGLEVNLAKPAMDPVEIKDAMFMTEHLSGIINAAKDGQTIFQADVYDGSDDGLTILQTTAIVGAQRDEKTGIAGEEAKIDKEFAGEAGWPVSVSYFASGNAVGEGEKLPLYQVSFFLHQSGVTRDLTMRYDDYTLKGDLKEIEYLPKGECQG